MGFLNWLKTQALGLVDQFNEKQEPFVDFTRPLQPKEPIKDEERHLSCLESFFRDGLKNFLDEGGALFQEVKPSGMGDLCIWQGVYSAYCSLGYAGMGEDGLAKFVSKDGVLYRGVAPKASTWYVVDPNWKQFYHDDGDCIVRDDASLDSLCGFIFGVAMANKRGRFTPSLKVAMKRLAERFVADNYRLKNVDGSFTRYGDCRPGLFQAPVRTLAAALVAYYGEQAGANTTGWRGICKKYGQEFERLETHLLTNHPWHNDHMAMLLASAAHMADPTFFFQARSGFDVLLRKATKQGNAFMIGMANFLREPCKPDAVTPEQKAIARKVLLEFTATGAPNGKTAGTPDNSDYPGVTFGGQRVATQPVPVWRRCPSDYVWQRNPYSLTGGDSQNYSGLDYLLAYRLNS